MVPAASASRWVESAVAAADDVLARANPIIAGPWFGEVGFELLYWIPFLRWCLDRWPEAAERLTVVSRGGASSWYAGTHARYVEILDTLTSEEYRRGRASAVEEQRGKQKQTTVTAFDRELIELARREAGVADYAVLHPSLVLGLYKHLWKESAVLQFRDVASYTRMQPPEAPELDGFLSDGYVAVRFYFSYAFPDTPKNRRIASGIIASLAEATDVVLLASTFGLDDHPTVLPDSGGRIFCVDPMMRPQDNLALQTAVIGRARGFVGTYGGFSYLPPMLGVPSLTFYSDPGRLHRDHLELAQRVFAGPKWGQLTTLEVQEIDLVRDALCGLSSGRETASSSSIREG